MRFLFWCLLLIVSSTKFTASEPSTPVDCILYEKYGANKSILSSQIFLDHPEITRLNVCRSSYDGEREYVSQISDMVKKDGILTYRESDFNIFKYLSKSQQQSYDHSQDTEDVFPSIAMCGDPKYCKAYKDSGFIWASRLGIRRFKAFLIEWKMATMNVRNFSKVSKLAPKSRNFRKFRRLIKRNKTLYIEAILGPYDRKNDMGGTKEKKIQISIKDATGARWEISANFKDNKLIITHISGEGDWI